MPVGENSAIRENSGHSQTTCRCLGLGTLAAESWSGEHIVLAEGDRGLCQWARVCLDTEQVGKALGMERGSGG